jgi:hypothetical protein
MGAVRNPVPEQIVVAAFSRHPEAMLWARTELALRLGPVALLSPPYTFDQTQYYTESMGPGLTKQLWTFENLTPPDSLPQLKLLTNHIEQQLTEMRQFAECRPLNLDPGLLGLAKFILATTKDQAHRIYLRDGIFAEITLQYRDKGFHPCPWTYADYRLPTVLQFLKQARADYRRRLATWQATETRDEQVVIS